MQLYYKVFSSTRHGFLGAGVVAQPLSHVWAAVSDPTLWPLYHKPIQTARLHRRVTKSINLGEPREGFHGLWPGDAGGGRVGGSPLGRLGLRLCPDHSGEVQLGVRLQNDGMLGLVPGLGRI